ncbi:Response regulator receiver domain-containing protein [Anaerovirgula multivorans]|uniref:Stage 0 sporulation protein A homolog n=1 Tax=Anaerovirgula multivorans TaxID=312168 RepID=A0A239KCK1_9FIRM|nr:response regulator [Anaerovirgula multivorans]SNT15359.1 Response regulator receiver domain-containing protein [Anaerovirgula multivorans]
MITGYLEYFNKDYDFYLIQACNGEELLEKIKRKSIDIAFLDIEMEGLNGIQVGDAIRAKFLEVMIVFITGFKDYVGSTGTTTASVAVESIYCRLTTYRNGTRIGFDGKHGSNTSSLSVGYYYGPYTSTAEYEVSGTHFGFLNESMADYYSYNKKTLP